MKRRIVLVVIFLIFFGNAFTANVPQSTARIIALNWLNAQSGQSLDETDIENVFTSEENGVPQYHIVSFDPQGWVIVSGSDAVEPVLGYATDTKFDVKNMPPQVSFWMSAVKDEVNQAEKQRIIPSKEVSNRWAQYKSVAKTVKKTALRSVLVTSGGPLMSVAWNQGRYYNEMAPSDSRSSTGNSHVWIGCVATAMAQVMKYWEYPSVGMGSHSYNHSDYGTLSANFENTTYNWANMPNSLSAQNADVQLISYHAAVSADMDFGPYSSGAYLEDAQRGLTNYFKYNTTVFESSKGDWTESEWMALMRSDIDAGRPIIYSGYNSTYSSGHAWVCDGYSGSYFHFNWGWGGTYNGNFLLSSLSPGLYNFSTGQAALFGIEPVLPKSIPIPYTQGYESAADAFSLMGVSSLTTEEVHTGTQSLKLGSESIDYDALNSASLCFVVPENAGLNFWVKRLTPSISVNNQQMAYLMPQYGTSPLAVIFDGDFNDTDWVNYNIDLSAYAGQIVRLLFQEQVTDASKKQWMYIDDVAITGLSSNLAPYTPSGPVPSNGTERVALSTTLRWNGGDPNGDALTYSVYFGPQNNMTLLGTTTATNYLLPGLKHSTSYFWKIIASDGDLTAESPVWSFTTTGIPPEMSVCGVADLSSTSVSICGEVTNVNGTTITERGICWTDTSIPSLSTEYQAGDNTESTFICNLEGLLPYTVYNYCSYSVSNEGVAYSQILSFKTLPAVPVVSITGVSDIFRGSATVSGIVNRINDTSITRRGVVWSQTEGFDPSKAEQFYEEGAWTANDVFRIELDGLPGPGSFYVRIFAENSAGVAYSNEIMITTTNSVPFVSLDLNNSSGGGSNNYLGKTIEQTPGGLICDEDAEVSDPDGDVIEKLLIEIDKPLAGNGEMLSLPGFRDSITVAGDSTTRLELTATFPLSYSQWIAVLRSVEYQNLLDAPDIFSSRKIKVKAYDGLAWGNEVTAFMYVTPVNDPPVVTSLPAVNEQPVLGNRIKVTPGVWVDSRDNTTCEFSSRYWWQVKDGDGIITDLAAEDLYYLYIDESFCGKQVRPVEEVTDPGCGGSSQTTAEAAGDWVDVGKAPQSITFGTVPTLYFHQKFFTFNGASSSGLPLQYSVASNSVISISSDTAYMVNAGSIVVTAIQPGDVCYKASSPSYKIVSIARGIQQIQYESHVTLNYRDGSRPIPAGASSGLPLVVVSSDSTVAYVSNDTIVAVAPGQVKLSISQPGNKNYFAAIPVEMNVEVLKGNQVINVPALPELRYGQPNVPFEVSASSSLAVGVTSSDPSVVEVSGDSLLIKGVGAAVLTVEQDGDAFWNPAESIVIPLVVKKGLQEIYVEAIEILPFSLSEYTPVYYSSSGLDVSFFAEDTTIAGVVDKSIIFKKAGSTVIHFIQQGNSLWEGTSNEEPLKIVKSDQSLTFTEKLQYTYGEAPVRLGASSSSGLRVAYEVGDASVAAVAGDTLFILGAGQTTITAVQPGNDAWNEALPVIVPLDVAKASQTIAVSLSDSVSLLQQFLIPNAQASSNLPVAISSSNTSVAFASGDTLRLLAPGRVDLSFVQNGDENYLPAILPFNLVVYEPVSATGWDDSSFSVYPNPSAGRFYVRMVDVQTSDKTIFVTDVTGRKIYQRKVSDDSLIIDLTGHNPGVYFLICEVQDRKIVKKLMLKDGYH